MSKFTVFLSPYSQVVMPLLRYLFSGFVRIRCIVRGAVVRVAVRACGGRCGPGLRVERGLRVRQGLHKGIIIGSNVYIGKDVTIDCPAFGEIQLDDGVVLTQGIFISAIGSVRIGANSMVGEYSSIRDANHGMEVVSPMSVQPLSASSIDIGADVWIGRGCAILSGVNVGRGAVIGANAVVNADVEKYAIVGGVPARLIRYRT